MTNDREKTEELGTREHAEDIVLLYIAIPLQFELEYVEMTKLLFTTRAKVKLFPAAG